MTSPALLPTSYPGSPTSYPGSGSGSGDVRNSDESGFSGKSGYVPIRRFSIRRNGDTMLSFVQIAEL